MALAIDAIMSSTKEIFEPFSPNIRLNDVVYSGDLLLLKNGLNVLQRGHNDSQIKIAKPLAKSQTNLSKLRIENMDNIGPIRYGQEIYLKHNALINNRNLTRFIKYGPRLQSHQEGTVYNLFKLVKLAKRDSTGYVKYGDQFLIACADQDGDKIYLKLEKDNSISPEGIIEDAIVFQAELLAPYTSNNLCVKPGEMIYS